MPPESGPAGTSPRCAIVTGASRGIGRAIAEALAGRGLRVIGTARQVEYGNPVTFDGGGSLEMRSLDLGDPSSIEAFVRQAPAPDILVNNAGQSQIGAAEEVPLEVLRGIFEVNFFGTVALTRELLPAIRKQAAASERASWVINVGSLAGRFPVPFQSAYVASKSALAGFTACLRSEVAGLGVHVVLLEPSDIRTTIEPTRTVLDDPRSPYREALQTMGSARDRAMAEAGPPEQVAETVLRLLDSGKPPRPVHPVGGHAPFFCFLKRLLPDAVVERLIRKRYGLA